MHPLVRRATRKLRRVALQKTVRLRSPLKVAIVGYGQIASDHVASFEETGSAHVVAVSDVSPAALGRALDDWPFVRAYRDYGQMLEEIKPDIVSVCTWPQLHFDVVSAAAAAGVKAIMCEKPLALTPDDVKKMLAVCADRGVKLAGGHQYRFHPNFIRAKEILRGGAFGTLQEVNGHIRSSLANNGPHLIDTVRFLLGDMKAEFAACECQRIRPEFNRGVPCETSAVGHVTFSGGLRFGFQSGDTAPSFFGIRLQGSKGTLDVSPDALSLNGVLQEVPGSLLDLCRQKQFGDFVAWARGRQSGYPADQEQSARTAELILTLYRAARVGGEVDVSAPLPSDVIGELYPDAREAASGAPRISPVPIPRGSEGRLAMDGGTRTVLNWFSTSPAIGAAEFSGVNRVLLSGNMGSNDGTVVRELEREFAAFYGSPLAVASTSGTAALHVAVGALNPEPLDEIITAPVSDMGTVIPILMANCVPVFADVDPATGNLTAESIGRKITPRTRAVIVVHLFGRPADLAPICDLLRTRNISLIEDCAQAHAAQYQGKMVGTFGDFGCFSLQQSKQITCGDGGLTLVNRADMRERATLFVDKGWDRQGGSRSHLFLGMNYRMTELQGAVALAQLRKLPTLIQARRQTADQLTDLLQAIPGIQVPARVPGLAPSWWKYLFGLDEEMVKVDIDDLADVLRAEGVRVGREYLPRPLFDYEVIRDRQTYGRSGYPFSAVNYQHPRLEEFPGYREFCRRMLLIGWGHQVQSHQVEGIASAVRKALGALSGTLVRRNVATVPAEALRT